MEDLLTWKSIKKEEQRMALLSLFTSFDCLLANDVLAVALAAVPTAPCAAHTSTGSGASAFAACTFATCTAATCATAAAIGTAAAGATIGTSATGASTAAR